MAQLSYLNNMWLDCFASDWQNYLERILADWNHIDRDFEFIYVMLAYWGSRFLPRAEEEISKRPEDW